MRDIKFRAYLKEYKVVVKVLTIDFEDKDITFESDEIEEWGNCVDFDDAILMKNIGLKDKNGVEMFEGDIVRSYDCDDNECIDFIVYNPYCQAFVLENVKEFNNPWGIESTTSIYDCADVDRGLMQDGVPYTDNFEIIGNVYVNPELLEGTNND